MARAFTYKVPDDKKKSIIIPVKIGVHPPINGFPENEKVLLDTKALIDTGASGSCISQQFADAIKLPVISYGVVRSAQSCDTVPIYTIDLVLPNNVMFSNISVTQFNKQADFDVIIGMDVFMHSDMAITNADNKMCFSLRIPAGQEHIDFTKNI